jgi:hypothetical protein
MPRMVKSESDARNRFDPFMDRLHRCVTGAIHEYRDPDYAKLRTNLSTRSDSSNINDLIWAKLRAEFEEEFRFTERRNRRTMHVGDDFNLRVKKLDPKMRPRNIVTQLVLDFLEQHPQQLRLPGLDPPTNVDLGYRLSGVAQTEIDVYLRCPKNKKDYHWMIELEEPVVAVPASPAAAPSPDESDSPEATPKRARPRREEVEPGRERTDVVSSE